MTKGHNSVDAGRLHSFVQRLEALADTKGRINQDMGEVFKEAKSAGYDVPALRQLLRERKMDEADRQERAELLRLYREACAA